MLLLFMNGKFMCVISAGLILSCRFITVHRTVPFADNICSVFTHQNRTLNTDQMILYLNSWTYISDIIDFQREVQL